MRDDIILHSLTTKRHKSTSWEGIEATLHSSDGHQFITIYKTQREFQIQNFNLLVGSVVQHNDGNFRIASIRFLPIRPKFAVCEVEKISSIESALTTLCEQTT